MHKGGHAVDIICFSLDTRFWTGTGTGTGTSCSGARLRACRNDGRLGGSAEFEIAAGEFIIGSLILEKDDFTESLASELKSDGPLNHPCLPRRFASPIDLAFTVGSSDNITGLPDSGVLRSRMNF
jgi:hypothetical protein